MADLTAQEAHRRVSFYLPEETEPSSPMLGGTTVILLMSLVPIPLTYFLNTQQCMHGPLMILAVGVVVLCLTVIIPYLCLRQMKDCDPVLYGNFYGLNACSNRGLPVGCRTTRSN